MSVALAAPQVHYTTVSNYCLPADSCFPSEATWNDLNATLAGHLIRPENVECEAPQCSDPNWRIEQPGGVMFLNFETGQGLDVQQTSQSVEAGQDTLRGDRTPSFVVDVREPSHVVEAVNFAKEHKLRLRIKNTGHDYLGRSSDPGSFTIWTHHLNATKYDPHFVPCGAPVGTEPQKAIIAGAGCTVYNLNLAASQAGVVIPAGVSKTVGGAGGFVLGGGHGPLSPLLGLAADNVLEFTLVTADGSVVKASPYENPALFTSLRGGGASSFGVVLETVFKASEPPNGFVGIFGTFSVQENATAEDGNAAWIKILTEFVDLQPKLSDAAPIAGYTYVRRSAPTPFAYILPSSDVDLAKSLFDPFFRKFAGDPSLSVDWHYHEASTWFELWNGEFTEALHSLDEVGINLLLGSRLIPRRVVEERSDDLAKFLAESKSPSIVHLVAGGAVAHEPEFPSSVNPAWRSALLHIDLPVAWPSSASQSTISSLTAYLSKQTKALGALSSSLGDAEASYPSESNFYEAEDEWRRIWYGQTNYERLEREKKKYDPHGVFGGRRTVGNVDI